MMQDMKPSVLTRPHMHTFGNSYLFVYGTLRQGNSLPINEQIAKDVEYMGISQVNGRLYDLGGYTGAIPGGKDDPPIKGEILKLKKPRKVLKLLDKYEGYDPGNFVNSEYIRKKQLVKLENGTKVQAWAYWYNLPVINKRRIANQDHLD